MKAHEAARTLGNSSCFGECPNAQCCRYLERSWQLQSVKYEDARKTWVVRGVSKGTCQCELETLRRTAG